MVSPKVGRRKRPKRSPRRQPRQSTHSGLSLAGNTQSVTKAGKQSTVKFGPREELIAASAGQVHWLQICLQKAETPTQADINGFSALHTASLHGRLDCIQMLVDKYRVNVDLASLTGWRPIHLVMSKESEDRALECLKYLIARGADVNVVNQNGVSPLHNAASEGRQNCIQALIDAGAEVHIKDQEGQEPIDLCRMWGHRACARTLASAMWKIDKANFAREVIRLNELKAECWAKEKEFLQEEQMKLDFGNREAYARWLKKKHLPPPSDRILSFLDNRATSVALGRWPTSLVSLATTAGTVGRGDIGLLRKDRRQRPWNISTNVSSMPVTCILRPDTVRIGTQPEKPLDHDFTSFLVLFKNAVGEPQIQMDDKGPVTLMPQLPFDVIQKNLFPHTRITRLEVPQGLKPWHIFDVPARRHPSPEHRWTDQMAVSLRETLDPPFIGRLEAHLATYTDPTVLLPTQEPSTASSKEPSAQSECSSRPD